MLKYCTYCMRITGDSRENVREFLNIIHTTINTRTGKFSKDRYFFRIFEAKPVTENHKKNIWEKDGIFGADIQGYCAWSIEFSMCSGASAKHDAFDNGYGEFLGTTLSEESARLNLCIEVFGREPSMGFSEHFLYKNGAELINESCDYEEIELEWYDTYREFCKESGYKKTKKVFLSEYPNGIYPVGGFKEEFVI